MKNRKKSMAVADFSLIAVLMILAAVVFLFQSAGEDGEAVLIKRNGELIKSVSLTQDIEYNVDGLLTVVVESGSVRVENAVCRDKLCEHMGGISKSGEIIVCLPNGITVEIVGGEYDFIV